MLPEKALSVPQSPVQALARTPVGAAEGCDLLILFLKIKVKRSQPSAAPAGGV
jgi:hypothetical protein